MHGNYGSWRPPIVGHVCQRKSRVFPDCEHRHGYCEPSLQIVRVRDAARSGEAAHQLASIANTLIDIAFYEVAAFRRAMKGDGLDVTIHNPTDFCGRFARALQVVDLSALANPEGAIVIVDATVTPHIQCFFDVSEFIDAKDGVSRIDSI
ncbi:hypothetical protein ACLKMY_13975 [Paraburkholderia mimosarum]|uniref:hypothetical protein n=1 Tax=Paraburkholderia mimosarum TaxID=312026 RepID=UPI0039C40B74